MVENRISCRWIQIEIFNFSYISKVVNQRQRILHTNEVCTARIGHKKALSKSVKRLCLIVISVQCGEFLPVRNDNVKKIQMLAF